MALFAGLKFAPSLDKSAKTIVSGLGCRYRHVSSISSIANTGPAISPAILGHISIHDIVCVPLRAMSLGALALRQNFTCRASLVIHLLSDSFKVAWIDAQRNSAKVVNCKPVRNWPHQHFIRETVSQPFLKAAISVNRTSGPQPARVGFVHLIPKLSEALRRDNYRLHALNVTQDGM